MNAPQTRIIRCGKCDLPLATSRGRSLIIGAAVVYAALRLECVRCAWGTSWHPAPKQKEKGTIGDG
jgi:hypothetical protein